MLDHPALRRVFIILALLLAPAPLPAQTAPALETARTAIPPAQRVVAQHGMVVAQDARAARIGTAILERGGNAVDAAVAAAFALAVAYPRAGNIGGGGFMMVHRADSGEDAAIDYRESAPAATTQDVFLGPDGEPDPHKSRDSGLAIGVPGTVAGMALALDKYGSGKFSLADLIAPSLALAHDGFFIGDDVADSLPQVRERLQRWPSTVKIFFNRDGTLLKTSDRLQQTDLAATLEAISRDGPQAFYSGAIADKIAAAVQAAGGRMTADDLKNYRALIRKPVRGSYRGYDIIAMPPPSSGGVHLIEMLNILEGFPLHELGAGSPAALHLMIEAMRRAYADRAGLLGDPDVVKVPVAGLISKKYADARRAEIDPLHATPSRDVRPGNAADYEGQNTTHFSVIDKDGNAVSNTYTLNFSYGVGLVADGTGILLNNELDDFTAKSGTANAYGLVGFEPNLPAPNKRPLSSMSPTIVFKDGKPVLITGSPGGSRIITTVLQIIVDVIDFGMDVAAAVGAPRIHHQWLPDVVYAEPSLPAETVAGLQALGHTMQIGPPVTSANSIAVTPEGIIGAADPRTRGALASGY